MSLVLEILDLHASGVRQVEIARRVHCSRANVTKTLGRYEDRKLTIYLPHETSQALIRKARSLKISPAKLCRLMVTDVIETEREKQDGDI